MTETQKAIEQEAEELYPEIMGLPLFEVQRQAYIAGRSKSLERERQLEDKLGAAKLALKEIYTGTSFPLSIAQNALQVINNTTFMPNDLKADEEKEKEIEVTEKLLNERQRVLDAIPECPEHGGNCVPHALEWITGIQMKNAQLEKEISELRVWKESSLSVTPDMQAIGKALGVRLGESVHDKILPGIERLKGLVYSTYRGWFIAFYRATSTMTARQIDDYMKEQWEEIKTKNNL